MAVKKKQDNTTGIIIGVLGLAGLIGLFYSRSGQQSLELSHLQAYDFNPDNFSDFYTIDDMMASDTATAQGIANVPSAEAIMNASVLAFFVLDPLTRYFYDKRLIINSWFRSPALNAAVGGDGDSDHLRGEAADIEAPDGQNNIEILKGIRTFNIPFDQLIIYDSFSNPSRVHVSYNPERTPTDQEKDIFLKTSSGMTPMTYFEFLNQLG